MFDCYNNSPSSWPFYILYSIFYILSLGLLNCIRLFLGSKFKKKEKEWYWKVCMHKLVVHAYVLSIISLKLAYDIFTSFDTFDTFDAFVFLNSFQLMLFALCALRITISKNLRKSISVSERKKCVFENSYLLLKAAAGGGGKGMRICYNEKFIYL